MPLFTGVLRDLCIVWRFLKKIFLGEIKYYDYLCIHEPKSISIAMKITILKNYRDKETLRNVEIEALVR